MTVKNMSPIGELTDALHQCQAKPLHPIFVVDDDPNIRHLSAEVLLRQGFEVNAAEDGATAWEEPQTDNYNLLITPHFNVQSG